MIVGYNPGSTINANWRLWDCGVTWGHLQPLPDAFDFSKLDSLVSESKGVLMLVLGHPAEWAADGGSDNRHASWLPPGSNRPPKDDRLWRIYCQTVMKRYAGKIKYYQIWNEPADPAFYSGDLETIARLSKQAKKIAAEIDPAARIVSAPLQPRPASGWPRRAEAIMDAYKRYDYPVHIWSAHIYPETNLGIARWETMVVNTKKLLARHGQSSKKLFVTETNYNVPNGPAINLESGKILTRKTLSRAKNLGVDGFWWYAAHNFFGLQPESLI